MKKIISLILALVILLAGLNVQFVTAIAEENEYLLKDYAENVKINSRAVFTENGLEADFAGGGFTVNVNCEGDVSLTLDWTGYEGKLGVIINDDFDNLSYIKVTKPGENTITIAQNLEKGNYTIEVTKQNSQQFNQIVFKSLQFTGEILEKPSEKEFKLQFIGDSISCGVGAAPEYVDGVYINGYGDIYYGSFDVFCARELNAELHTCAIPGYGYYVGSGKGYGEDMYTYFDKSTVLQDIPYDNSNYIADVVVIELGSNDNVYAIKNEIVVEDKQAYQLVQRYVDKIREFNKDCHIILMNSFGSDGGFNVKNRSSRQFFRLTNAIKRTAFVNEKVYYYQQPKTTLTGWIYHPNVSEAKVLGKALAEYIREDILTGKESPYANDPKDFYYNYDINEDDKLDSKDVLFMRNFLIKKLKNVNLEKYDVNLDSGNDIVDLLNMRKKLAEV